MFNTVRFLNRTNGSSTKGQGMVEYTFIISLVALALVIAFKTLGLELTAFFTAVGTKIQVLP